MNVASLDYPDAAPRWDDSPIWRTVARELVSFPMHARAFDLGCGNGHGSQRLFRLGFDVTAVDPSPTGIAVARAAYPGVRFEQGGIDDDLAGQHGTFDALVSVEVIEHCYSAARFAATVRALLKPGGLAIISTPYHGYAKNLAIALAGKWDGHHDSASAGGHIKFFSVATLTALFEQHGFTVERVHRVGRVPVLAKSMVLVARRD